MALLSFQTFIRLQYLGSSAIGMLMSKNFGFTKSLLTKESKSTENRHCALGGKCSAGAGQLEKRPFEG